MLLPPLWLLMFAGNLWCHWPVVPSPQSLSFPPHGVLPVCVCLFVSKFPLLGRIPVIWDQESPYSTMTSSFCFQKIFIYKNRQQARFCTRLQFSNHCSILFNVFVYLCISAKWLELQFLSNVSHLLSPALLQLILLFLQTVLLFLVHCSSIQISFFLFFFFS